VTQTKPARRPSTEAARRSRSSTRSGRRRSLGASGDTGSTDYTTDFEDGVLSTTQVNSWPSSDPLVASVGGTQMNLDDSGDRLSPDVVWKRRLRCGRRRAELRLQAARLPERCQVGGTFAGASPGYHSFGGTSAATPEFSGIVAMADQVAGHSLGTINSALYSIPYGGGLVDVTSGNSDIGPFQNAGDPNIHDVPG
jgi:subtilase family serine protease